MVAVFYKRDGYDTSGKRLMGRQSAGEGFLKGLIQHGTAETIYCCADQQREFSEFCDRVKPWMSRQRQLQWITDSQPEKLAQAGVLYRPDTALGELAWQRRFGDQRGYSLCGVTHTIASKETLKMLGDLLIAPVQPWDALVCTSQVAKTAIEQLLDQWADYLEVRIGSRPTTQVQLPVIPLGVDCSLYPSGVAKQELRDRLRQKYNIPAEDIVVLYVGRLIFSAKAHPVPMYLALEQAARSTQQQIHLIQAGWFEEPREEVGFRDSVKAFCPSVKVQLLDGRSPELQTNMLAAIGAVADIFLSLVDNVQETFGLTPIEAMAAGLPVVVSDWNGYRETVRHERDGLRIPTLTPPPGMGLDLAVRYGNDKLNYSTYVGHAAMRSAVDVTACAQALIKLIEQPELRQKLGQNAAIQARSVYDWQVVIGAYEALWADLDDRRSAAAMVAPLRGKALPCPLLDDPFRQFAHYPTMTLRMEQRLAVSAIATPELLRQLQQVWITNFGANERLPIAGIEAMIAFVGEGEARSVAAVLAQFGDDAVICVMNTLVYLIKFGVLVVADTKLIQQ
jgi:alpha-maltose-1-phosphate synthase